MMRCYKVKYIELLVGQEKRNIIIDNVNGHRKTPRPRADRFG